MYYKLNKKKFLDIMIFSNLLIILIKNDCLDIITLNNFNCSML